MSRRPAWTVVATMLALLGVAACGVSDDPEPRAIDPEDVPFSLLAPSSSVPDDISIGTGKVVVYLVDQEGRLTQSLRPIVGRPDVTKAIEALLLGPTEADKGLGTAITSGTRLLGIDGPHDGLVTIDLTSDLLDVTGGQQIRALAQVVKTATRQAPVEQVLFKFDGQQTEVLNGKGELTAAPLDGLDYRESDLNGR